MSVFFELPVREGLVFILMFLFHAFALICASDADGVVKAPIYHCWGQGFEFRSEHVAGF